MESETDGRNYFCSTPAIETFNLDLLKCKGSFHEEQYCQDCIFEKLNIALASLSEDFEILPLIPAEEVPTGD